eukprot:TRINITY_DN2984_c0_g1_i1.p1 TRINITY_DN2984_c0_g1~~TRINITY_DN2984_c0_g1_i1.p1  ORF type:complete len:293 (+),score=55.27 TRINITY_DN2984_c0_g1_i1:180-1058(+)
MSRPEHQAPPEIFYNDDEAKKYAVNSRMIKIQSKMTERAMELMNLPEDKSSLLLDLGCGSGLSGEVLTDNGHMWVGLDISEAMLNVAVDREVSGDLVLSDLGQGLMFRAGSFDGAVSISAIQWLCNADKKSHNPRKRLMCFFQSLYNSLTIGGKAVFQFYPETPQQMELITSAAMRCGFSGGLVIDYPHSTKAKKFFLVLFAGGQSQELPQGKDVMDMDGMDYGAQDSGPKVFQATAKFSERDGNKRQFGRKRRKGVKDRAWVEKKKERQRKQGKKVKSDSAFTARKRPGAF